MSWLGKTIELPIWVVCLAVVAMLPSISEGAQMLAGWVAFAIKP